jgi:hypothetical protein
MGAEAGGSVLSHPVQIGAVVLTAFAAGALIGRKRIQDAASTAWCKIHSATYDRLCRR